MPGWVLIGVARNGLAWIYFYFHSYSRNGVVGLGAQWRGWAKLGKARVSYIYK